MRTGETVLLTINLLSLLLLCRRTSKVLWLGMAGVNTLALLIHGTVEGFRYEMNLSYVLVILLLVCVPIQISSKFSKVRVPKGLRITGISALFVLIAINAFLIYAFPVFTLPKPTGDYAVGIKYFALIDETRADPFLNKSTRMRELMVKVYYPAAQDDAKPFSPYFHGSTKLTQAWAVFYQMPVSMLDHLTLVKTHSKDNLQVLNTQSSYPVVLFSNGAGTSMEVETSQSEDLASHGYIVVDIDHPYVSAATVFPDRIVTAQEATTNFDTPEPANPITQIMADDDKFIIRKLGEMNEGSIDTAFKGKLNLGKIGVIGHSVGGAVAYNMAINDSRVKAAINLDGTVYVTPKNSRSVAPFLMLANDKYHIQAIKSRKSLMKNFDATPESQQEMQMIYGSKEGYKAEQSKAEQNMTALAGILKASGNLYTIEGSDHMKFTDIGLFIGSKWLRELVQIGGKTSPARCLTITQSLTVAFFDQHLKGKTDTLPSVVRAYPELNKVDLD